MDTSEYLPMFLAECREHLQELNICVVRLEEAPEDGSTIDEIFRGAHSLKGMSGAMGFANIAELTHQMEDVFELVRQGNVVLGREAVDVLLACLDALSGAVDAIDSTGEEQLDPAPLVARLRGLVHLDASGAPTSSGPGLEEPVQVRPNDEETPETPRAEDQPEADAVLVEVTVHLGRETQMPAVRVLQAIAVAETLGSLVSSTPSGSDVDTFTGAEILVALTTSATTSEIEAAFLGIPDVAAATAKASSQALSRAADPKAAANTAILSVTVQLSRETQMPAVRALQVIAVAESLGTVVSSKPAADAIDGFVGGEIAISLATETIPTVVERAFGGVPDIVGVKVGVPPVAGGAKIPGNATDGAGTTGQGAGHSKRGSSSTVRVDSERLDQLMHLMGELVVHRTRVESFVGAAGVPGLAQSMQDLTRSSQALQAMVMQVRMIPVDAVFMRFPRLVRDLSSKLGKQVELVLTGSDTELDRTVVEALGDPIVHLVRNSLDHGLESADDRRAAGKSPTGRLEIEARHAGGNVVIIVRDDGRGVDPAQVARRAVERGLLTPEAESSVDVKGAIELLFAPGFSTAETTSDISGRGVGMDAVRTAIRELGGEVIVGSDPGQGTTATIRLPLTLAIVATLLVETGSHPFAIQLDRVERTVRLDEHPVRSVAGRKMLMLRDGVLPIVDLSESLGYGPSGETPHAVIVRGGDRWLALAVERLVGQRELVTRALPTELAGAPALSGGAVLSNGDIALIVDCDALAGGNTSRGIDVAEAA